MNKEDLQKFADLCGLTRRSDVYKHAGHTSIINDYYMLPEKRNKFYCFTKDWNPSKSIEQAILLAISLNNISFKRKPAIRKWKVKITTNPKVIETFDTSLAKAICRAVKKYLKAQAAPQKNKSLLLKVNEILELFEKTDINPWEVFP